MTLAALGLAGCMVTVVPDRYYVVDGPDAVALARHDAAIVDLRPPDDYARGHVQGALSIPLSQLWIQEDELPQRYDAPILLYDDDFSRGERAAVRLKQEGYFRVYVLRGGLAAWAAAGGAVSQEAPPPRRDGTDTWF